MRLLQHAWIPVQTAALCLLCLDIALPSAGSAQEALHPGSSKPQVVVIESTEAADLNALQDLILVLSEVRLSYPHSP